jgi:hypothetical protein
MDTKLRLIYRGREKERVRGFAKLLHVKEVSEVWTR